MVVRALVSAGEASLAGEFVWPAGVAREKYDRFRRPAPGADARDMEFIAPEEIAAAAAYVLRNSVSLGFDDLLRETMRLFGIARLGRNVAARIEAGIHLLVARGLCIRDGERARWAGQ